MKKAISYSGHEKVHRLYLIFGIGLSFGLTPSPDVSGQCDTGPGVAMTHFNGQLVAQVLGEPQDGPYFFDFTRE